MSSQSELSNAVMSMCREMRVQAKNDYCDMAIYLLGVMKELEEHRQSVRDKDGDPIVTYGITCQLDAYARMLEKVWFEIKAIQQ